MTDSRRPLSAHFDAAPDDFDHPEHSELVSLVDERLDEVDREWIVGHIEACQICREDVDDLVRVKSSLLPQPVSVHQRRWMRQSLVIGAAAAGVVLAIWMGGRRLTPDAAPVTSPVPEVTTAPATAPPEVMPEPTVKPASVLTEEEQGRVTRALASGRLELPGNISVLRGHAGALLGAGDTTVAFTPTAPIGTAIIDARPLFSWTPMAGATRYFVTVWDERFRAVAKSGALKTTKWTPSRDLPRGRVLAWQITAVTRDGTAVSPAPPQPEARFAVLDAATVAGIARTRTPLAKEPIALGLALAKIGLFADAESAFQSALTDERYDFGQVQALITRLRAR